jgi:two-component system chemotaxis response regulator CheB
MSRASIRVLVAEDSPTVRQHLTRLINETPGLQVVGEARDGAEAIQLAESLRPDVISMDIRMPVLDGLEATRRIMARHPTPIVMVSGLLDAEINLSFQALEAGALAVVGKPPARGETSYEARGRQLVTTLAAMARVSVVRRWERAAEIPAVSVRQAEREQAFDLIAIGASAGGPSALSTLLSDLPHSFSLPLLVVQHMPEEFIPGLARWLAESTGLNVAAAEQDMPLESRHIYLAPGGKHLIVARAASGLRAQLLPNTGRQRYCPAVDVLFESVATVCGKRGVGIVLTGMGDDGAEGLLRLRQAGGRTFAQDRAGCTVFGMPAAALERGGVEQMLSLTRLAELLRRLA